MAPVPKAQRWRTKFEAIQHHLQYMHMYEGFLKVEGDRAVKLLEIVSSADRLAAERASMQFVVDACPTILDLLTWCEFRSLPSHLFRVIC